MILKIGITGGMGGGKTMVAKVFEVLGIPVYYADDAAKRLMNEDDKLKEKLTEFFGNETYVNGKLNRPFLSQIVFTDPEKLALLNSIIHPLTISDSKQWMLQQTTPYAIKEAALIFESGFPHQLDYVIGVTAPAEVRIQRVMKRDQLGREAILARMAKQLDEKDKMQLCDYIINNDETQLVIPQVIQLHQVFIDLEAKNN